MFDGKEKRLALIDELLIVASTKKIDEEEEQTLVRSKEARIEQAALQEGIVGKLMEKRMIHNNERKMKAQDINGMIEFMKNAEDERKMRENRETGTRQAEQVIKNREEKLYREVTQVHQNTVGGSTGRTNGRLAAPNHLRRANRVAEHSQRGEPNADQGPTDQAQTQLYWVQ